MSKRALSVGMLTAGLSAGLIAGVISPAAAQGNPVSGSGSVYFLSGAGSTGGQAQVKMYFGDPGDEVYFGDWDGDGIDTPMVSRGGVFHVADQAGKTVSIFGYGDPGDQVLVGDWDGNGEDSITVRRGNHFFVKNDNTKTGKADADFYYGDNGDTVLVGDWNGDDKDTLIVQRDSRFFVKNDTSTGAAEYDFYYGDKGDSVLVGDWANPAEKESGNGADQLAVRRQNHYFLSTELGKDKKIEALRDIYYGEANDTVFVAALPTDMKDDKGKPIIDEVREATYSEDSAATY